MSSVGYEAINIDENSIPRDHMENEMIDSQLHECVRQNINTEEFRRLVQQRSAEKLVTPCGNTLLHVAVSYGSDNITSYLAETFPSLITIQNSQKDTILHLAAREGKATHAIRSLVESNPSLMRKTNTKGNTPLHDAVITDNKEVAIFLVSRDPEVAYYSNKNGRSPLYLAVENGNKKEILDDLLKTEASFPIESEDGDALPKRKSPVHAAIEQRNIDLLEKIAKAKPELLCLTDEELGNSLHYASSICFLEGVRFLLKKFLNGASETNSEGNYPIHVACKNGYVDLLKDFLNIFPYPTEFLNRKGQNILHAAAEYGQVNVVRYILENDQKIVEPLLNGMDEDGNTPLHLAARHGHLTAAFVLVRDKRVGRLIVNHENLTPYEVAEQQSKSAEEEFEKVYEMGKAVDLNKQDTKKASPKDDGLINYFKLLTILSILFFHARPMKTLYERFTVTPRPMSRAKEETKSRIENLLVVTVLVAGLTFAGTIQLPQLRVNSNSMEHHHELSSTYENLLYGYLIFDVGALTSSLVAALVLLWANFNDAKFKLLAVNFSAFLVFSAITMMMEAFSFSVRIALLGSPDVWLAITITIVAYVFFLPQAFVLLTWILPRSFNQILHGILYYFLHGTLFTLFYSWRWLTDQLTRLKRLIASFKRFRDQ